MKVVLFCGGLGLRIRDHPEKLPKPMIHIGGQPILWHIMKYYAHFGHNDFILCLGHRGDAIKRFFLDYDPRMANDFTLSGDPTDAAEVPNDLQSWRITFVDTGLHSSIGERLRLVREYLRGERYFLASYSDTLTDAPLNSWIEHFKESGNIASFMCVHPNLSLHHVTVDPISHQVMQVDRVRNSLLINGGHFVFRHDIFDHLRPHEELVEQPFARLIERRALLGQMHDGFWATMDTFKDHQMLEQLYESGEAPWQVWRSPSSLPLSPESYR